MRRKQGNYWALLPDLAEDMEAEPQLSVIMPVYNRHEFLSEALGSIFDQSFSDFELLIVNDGSTNGKVLEIIDQARKDDRRTRVINQENKGPAGARNTGIAQARAPLIALMDDDDVSLKDRLWTQHAFLKSTPDCAAVTTGMIFINKRGKEARRTADMTEPLKSPEDPDLETSIDWVEKVNVNPSSMIRKSALDEVGSYRPWFRQIEDIDLTLRMLEAGLRICVLHDRLYLHRVYKDPTRLSQGGMPWDYYGAAVLSLCCRQAGLDDPVEEGIDPALVHARFREMPAAGRQHMIWKARSTFRKLLRDGDKRDSRTLWRKCKGIAADAEDVKVIMKLKKRVAMWRLLYFRTWSIEGCHPPDAERPGADCHE